MRPATEGDVPEEHRRKIIGSPSGDQTSLARQIRAKADFFRSIGIHINGISKEREDGTVLIWIQRPTEADLEVLGLYLGRIIDIQNYPAIVEELLKRISVRFELSKDFQGPIVAARGLKQKR